MNTQQIYQRVIRKLPFVKSLYNAFFGPKRYRQLFEIIRETKPKNIMEIGVWDGDHGLQMIKEANKFHEEVAYYGFDLFEDIENHALADNIEKKPLTKQQVYDKLRKVGARVKLFKGDTHKTLPKVVPTLPKMDFIFIDGGHTIETIKNDFTYAQKLMHDDTIIVFDDYWNRDDIGSRPFLSSLDTDEYDIQVLPIKDTFNKEDGLLTIHFAKLTKH